MKLGRTKICRNALAVAVGLAMGSTALLAQDRPDEEAGIGPSTERPGISQSGDISSERRAESASERAESASEQSREAGDESSPFGADDAEDDSPFASEDDRSQDSQDRPSAQASSSSADLDQLAQDHDELSGFVDAVKSAGLVDALTDGTEYTIFAPTNDALESSGHDLDELKSSQDNSELVSLLRAHIIADDVDREMASNLPAAQTIDGGTLELSSEDGELTVGDAKAKMDEDIQVGNVRIYMLDGVLAANASQPAASIGSQESETQPSRSSEASQGAAESSEDRPPRVAEERSQ